MDPLKRVEKEIKKCVKCGACRAHCPVFGELKREPAVARGKVALAKAVLEGGMELDDRTYLDMSKCLLCGSCVEKCANDVPTDEIVVAAREALAQRRASAASSCGPCISVTVKSRASRISPSAQTRSARAGWARPTWLTSGSLHPRRPSSG